MLAVPSFCSFRRKPCYRLWRLRTPSISVICFRPTVLVELTMASKPQRCVASTVRRCRHCFVTELTRMATHSHPEHPCCSKLHAAQNDLVVTAQPICSSLSERASSKLRRPQKLLRRALTWLHCCPDLCASRVPCWTLT